MKTVSLMATSRLNMGEEPVLYQEKSYNVLRLCGLQHSFIVTDIIVYPVVVCLPIW